MPGPAARALRLQALLDGLTFGLRRRRNAEG